VEQLLLEAKNVSKSFASIYAVRDGGIELRPGRVHALCGGNGAGKSTFLGMLTGQLRRDGGTIVCKGKPVDFHSPAQALAAGIAIITQELSPVLDMSVAENIYLGREPMRIGGLAVDHAQLVRDAGDLMRKLGFDIEPRAKLRSLSLAKRQLVEIAKAISRDSQILIMDEPTSAIGEAETKVLFRAIQQLTSHGVGVIYVSHRFSEIFEIAQDYTVFRDGQRIESGLIANINREKLIQLIVGGSVTRAQRPSSGDKPLMLQVQGFSHHGTFSDINLKVGRGEILGIYGLMGAGRTEFVNAIYGLDPHDAGELSINGIPVTIRTPKDAIAQGIALITEDRKESGLVGVRSVRENITLSSLSSWSNFGVVSAKKERGAVQRMIDRFRVRLASPELEVQKLSGGNQQKVVLSRCLLNDPRILLCDEPTRGIDEGTKQQIYQFLSDFVAQDKCAIVVSSELDEVLQISDRIAVFRRGRLVGELTRSQASHEALTHMAS
jgi:ABC-type sugar transport system ATPase subunit